jgi:hypothetical protein
LTALLVERRRLEMLAQSLTYIHVHMAWMYYLLSAIGIYKTGSINVYISTQLHGVISVPS